MRRIVALALALLVSATGVARATIDGRTVFHFTGSAGVLQSNFYGGRQSWTVSQTNEDAFVMAEQAYTKCQVDVKLGGNPGVGNGWDVHLLYNETSLPAGTSCMDDIANMEDSGTIFSITGTTSTGSFQSPPHRGSFCDSIGSTARRPRVAR